MSQEWKKYLISILIFIFGIIFGLVINPNKKSIKNAEQSDYSEVNFKEQYPHINPLKFCDSSSTNPINSKASSIEETVKKVIKESDITASVYYRNLNNGPWFIINPDEKYYAQSLLKVPLAMAYYHIAEENSQILDNTLKYDGQYEEFRNLDIMDSIEKGKEYKTEELISQMLINSDNQALRLLLDQLGMLGLIPELERTNKELSLDQVSGEMGIKDYSEMMRILYNSTYLSREHSEKILSILSNTSYKKGLVAGFPDNAIIAHKFGVKESNIEGEDNQLHDCGIVYLSSGEHLICVMTKGKDLIEQSNLIKNIAKTIAEKIDI